MNNAVTINPNNSAVNRYAQHLSNAQSYLNDAITRANSIRTSLPGVYPSISSMTLVKIQLTQLISDLAGTVSTLSQSDIENAKGIFGYDGNFCYASDLSSTSRPVSIIAAIPNAFNLSDDLISAIVRNQHGELPISQAKGFAFEYMLARKENLSGGFTRAKVLANNKTGQDVLLQGIFKSEVIEAKAGSPDYAYTVQKRSLMGDYPDGVTATKELAIKLDELGVKNVNSGISVFETERVAALSRGSSTVGKFVTKSVLKNAGKAGVLGAIIGVGVETVFSYNDYKNGTISGKQYANNIARESVAGLASAAVTTVAIGALSVAALPGVAVVAVGVGVGVAVGAGVNWLWNMIAR